MREDGRRPVDAIDHSESKTVYVNVSRSPIDTSIMISDKGEGIFKRIRRLKEFSSEHEAILELSKGKLTIDPEKHTGEGIFFASRMFDLYFINSEGLAFSHHENFDALQEVGTMTGTTVTMEIANNSETVDSAVCAVEPPQPQNAYPVEKLAASIKAPPRS